MIICLNCNKPGHAFRTCNKPIRSYGIIAYKKTKSGLKFLMIRRRNTIGYIDFLRGKYKLYNKINIEKVKCMIGEMTDKEKLDLLTLDFDTIWDQLWLNHSSGIYLNEKEKCRKIFNMLDVKRLIKDSGKSRYFEQEYGFPKGRKNMNESPTECAIREFKEETCLKDDDFKLCVFFNPILENFIGSDNVKYSHYYYLAEITRDIDLEDIEKNTKYLEEVSKIGLYSYQEAYKLIRDYDVQKKHVLTKVYYKLSR